MRIFMSNPPAYAFCKKDAVENCNRIVRRFYPNGSDLKALTRAPTVTRKIKPHLWYNGRYIKKDTMQ